MAATLPYTYIQCPCASQGPVTGHTAAASAATEEDEEADERDLDPRAPRSNYSLYPLEYLLYCEDCQQIRCPRCVLDEIVTWYCPNCLFEVPSSTVRTEGNRCTRSCFECPSCTAPLSVTSLEPPASDALLKADNAGSHGPFILSCPYCAWCSSEVGLQFEKHNGIYNQMFRKPNATEAFPSTRDKKATSNNSQDVPLEPVSLGEDKIPDMERAANIQTIEARFATLRSFYQSQITKTSSAGSLGISSDLGYGSPGNLSRIMSLYSSGSFSDPKSKSKVGIMREAQTESEGLRVLPVVDDIVPKLRDHTWAGTTTHAQRDAQLGHPRFVGELQPVPYLLRTKRSKRCRTCRHILFKPEAKVQNTRFRIRLVALNYIPTITIKPLSSPQSTSTGAPVPKAVTATSPTPTLTPHKPVHFLLTLRNPIFDPIKVTLATPTHTPGRFPTRTTILCPQFEVGANTDVWDEALQAGGSRADVTRRRTTARDASDSQTTPEAGKIWDKGRNWTTVAVEVVPADVYGGRREGEDDGDALKEDEDVLEIPIFMRLEWESEMAHGESADVDAATVGVARKEGEGKEKRELAYWCVLGIGRIEKP